MERNQEPKRVSIYDSEVDETLECVEICRLQTEDGLFTALMYLGDDLPEDSCPLVILEVVEKNGKEAMNKVEDEALLLSLVPSLEARILEDYSDLLEHKE